MIRTPRLLLKRIETLVTMVDGEPPLTDVDLLIEGGRIRAIGRDLEVAPDDDTRVIDGSNRVVYPGFVNTHHHLFQTLTRNLPPLQNAKLFDWLIGLYEVWRGHLTPEAVEVSTRVGLAELLLSGCTTTSDHLYLFGQAGAGRAARRRRRDRAPDMGIALPSEPRQHEPRKIGRRAAPGRHWSRAPTRFCATASAPSSKPPRPRPPVDVPGRALAPCSPFSVTTELLRRELPPWPGSAVCFLHTHLCRDARRGESSASSTFGKRPVAYMEECDWLGEDVWFAHSIWSRTTTRSKRLARPPAPASPTARPRTCDSARASVRVPRLLEAGVKVGLAVDGSASNDASSMTRELQLALLVHRVGTGVGAMPAERVLRMATRGGAKLLGRDEIGRLEPGAAADLAVFRLDRVDFAGAMHDPAAAILYCGSGIRADYTIVAGKVLVEDGRLVGIDEERLFHRANEIATRLVDQADA